MSTTQQKNTTPTTDPQLELNKRTDALQLLQKRLSVAQVAHEIARQNHETARQQALTLFGTDDIDQISTLYRQTQKQLQTLLQTFDTDLQTFETQLSFIEQQLNITTKTTNTPELVLQ